METIRSARNPRLQRVRSLVRTSARRDAALFVIEGEDLVAAAIQAGCVFADLLVRDETPWPQGAGLTPLVVQGDVLDGISALGSGTRQIGVVRTNSLPQSPATLSGLAVALCGVGDPGNVGTLLRSAAAFNAFLKTLEEPPAHAIFILATTEKHKIIPTILSRCQIFDFNRIKIKDIADHLASIAEKEGVQAEAEALHVIATKADGAMRDALSIFDQVIAFCGRNLTYSAVIQNLNVLDYDYYFKLTDLILAEDVAGCLVLFDEVFYRIFIKEGRTDVVIYDWTQLDVTNENSFMFDTSFMIPREYMIEIKGKTHTEEIFYNETIKFEIVSEK